MAPPAGTDRSLAVVLLAAGQGTRLRSRIPKPLHHVGGRPLIDHVLHAAAALGPTQTIVVTGHGADHLRHHLGLDGAGTPTPTVSNTGVLTEAHQAEQLGTAHAVSVALPHLVPGIDTVVVLYADTPLITGSTLAALAHARHSMGATLAIVTCPAPDPFGYGRVVRDAAGKVTRVVEEKVASPAERAIVEVNAGFYAVDAAWLRAALPRVERSATGEYFLPDLVDLAVADARGGQPWPVATASAAINEVMGINDRVQLAEAAALLRARTHRRLLLSGVTLVDPASIHIDDTVEIGQDTVVHPFTIITGQTRIGSDCVIGPHATIDACTIGDGCRVHASTLESSTMEAGSDIGPYSHLRPGAHLGPGVHVGNFAEIKNASLGAGTLMGHVGYIGDAKVGERVNIGAGAITANFDGQHKHHTTIGDDAFIGCDTILIAPVEVASGSATGASAVVNHDVPPATIAIGVPARHRPRKPRRDQ